MSRRPKSHPQQLSLLAMAILVIIVFSLSVIGQNDRIASNEKQLTQTREKSIVSPALPNNSLWDAPPKMGLVKIKEAIPGVKVKLKYAGPDNFTQTNLYGAGAEAWLQPEVATKLKAAQSDLQQRNPHWTLIVYDAARPQRVQEKMWATVKGTKNERYVAPPQNISLHSYGVAVDLSIWDNQTAQALDMGTDFDSFTPASEPKLENQMLQSGQLSTVQVKNRQILRSVMTQSGFWGIPNEWWHFNAFSRSEAAQKYQPIP